MFSLPPQMTATARAGPGPRGGSGPRAGLCCCPGCVSEEPDGKLRLDCGAELRGAPALSGGHEQRHSTGPTLHLFKSSVHPPRGLCSFTL